MKPVKMRPIVPSVSLPELCLSSGRSLTNVSLPVRHSLPITFPGLPSSSKENSMTHHRRVIAYAIGRLFAVVVLAVFGILSMPSDAAAQSQVGTLVGNVRDESGGAIPGATVTAREVRTNISRTAVSNEAGNYTFTN